MKKKGRKKVIKLDRSKQNNMTVEKCLEISCISRRPRLARGRSCIQWHLFGLNKGAGALIAFPTNLLVVCWFQD